MSWMIVSDSSCELRTYQTRPSPSTVPLKIRVGERNLDNAALDGTR